MWLRPPWPRRGRARGRRARRRAARRRGRTSGRSREAHRLRRASARSPCTPVAPWCVWCLAELTIVSVPSSYLLTRQQRLTSGRAHLVDGHDDGLEAARQDRRSEYRRWREHGYIERGVDQEGHEAEESPEALRAVRARGEEALGVQGVQRLSARSSAP